ncbi:DNA mismatch repair protein MutS2 [Cyclonatronum proteinivorum]|uniref:Endonuclease MutS2 n=1 Tax=Cyclonatronum proteinivorum TaxID=1457365 RepID=A0A345UGA4_9BACT|nr:endonuclease MutS2 [Cyclonatronum proteinivorum]AXI99505.1 DNA mismatch repair protein MutS2 [Cyclonatronum proteinivorum]
MKVFPPSTSDKLGFTAITEATSVFIRSEMGQEELQSLKPVSAARIVSHKLSLLCELMDALQYENEVPFEHPHDIREFAKRSRVKRAILNPEQLYQIRQFCVSARLLKNYLRSKSETHPLLSQLSQEIIPLKELEKKISEVVSEHGSVKDSASAALRQIRKSLGSRRNELRSAINRIIRQMSKDGYLAEFEATIRNGRMVLPVRAEHKRRISGFVQDVSATGQTVYLEPTETLHINNDIRELEQQERAEIERILMALTAEIGGDHEHLLSNAGCIGRFDLLLAIARFSLSLGCTIPEIGESRQLSLENARNPVLMLRNRRMPKEEREEIVPLNIKLETQEKGVIITGPNAGGKSVSLKTVALLSMMAQSGFAIPADDTSSLPLFTGLWLDMGDEQSIDNDLSTFSSRLAWMRETLKGADAGSLILVDEAGTGTDPEEGVALFQAFLEILHARGCTILATTHHGNLKVFAHNYPGFVNASMEFDRNRLTPTYRFRKGVPGSSYAFEMSERLGLSPNLLSRARELVGESKNKLESLITEMEEKAQEAGEIRSKTLREQVKAEKLIRNYEQRLKTLTAERDKLREKALLDARDIMQSANARIEEAIQKVYEAGTDKEKIKEIRAEVGKHRQEVEKDLQQTSNRRKGKETEDQTPPQPGDPVRLTDSNATGELIEVNGKQAVVDVNGLRLKTKYKNLVKTKKPKPQKREPVFSTADDDFNPIPVPPSLDIRGYRGEEAGKELMHYLDRVSASSLRRAEIIHGKGDGILKKIVHEQLSKRGDVRKFDFAPWEQGGPGCTIVEFA